MLTDNGCVQRFDVFIPYTHMQAADGSDGRALAWRLLFRRPEKVNMSHDKPVCRGPNAVG